MFVMILNESPCLTNSQLEPPDFVEKVLNCRSKNGSTVLIHSIEQRRHEVAEVLLKAKADANVQNARGMTALHVAAALAPPEVELQELLILHGADGTVTTKVRCPALRPDFSMFRL